MHLQNKQSSSEFWVEIHTVVFTETEKIKMSEPVAWPVC